MTTDILCIGSALWDVIGRAGGAMRQGADVPGRITRQPGGVALNIAMTVLRFGLRPVLLSAVGRDAEGEELLRICSEHGMDIAHVWRSDSFPTDRYMAVEGTNGLIAAIADAYGLENAGNNILAPLQDGRIASATSPYTGPVALDGNLTLSLLEEIAQGPLLAAADLRIAPASPGKADRLLPFVKTGRGTLYVNLEEAGILGGALTKDAARAAATLLNCGAERVIVTNGPDAAADGSPAGIITGQPPVVEVAGVTGAGDTFMAAHIAAEQAGCDRQTALSRALQAAAAHISGRIAS